MIKQRLDKMKETGEVDIYTKCIICDMTKRIIRSIARSNKKVKEGVQNIMGGKVLEHEAKTILNRGIEQGEKRGKKEVKKKASLIC